MNLPYINSNLLAFLDPSEKYVSKNTGFVNGVADRVSGSFAMQTNQLEQPKWSQTALNNTPALIFLGGQRLRLPLPASTCSGTGVPLTVIMAA